MSRRWANQQEAIAAASSPNAMVVLVAELALDTGAGCDGTSCDGSHGAIVKMTLAVLPIPGHGSGATMAPEDIRHLLVAASERALHGPPPSVEEVTEG